MVAAKQQQKDRVVEEKTVPCGLLDGVGEWKESEGCGNGNVVQENSRLSRSLVLCFVSSRWLANPNLL